MCYDKKYVFCEKVFRHFSNGILWLPNTYRKMPQNLSAKNAHLYALKKVTTSYIY